MRRVQASEANLCERPTSPAFTLVELLVALGILGALAALALGGLQGARRQSAVGRARAELAALGLRLEVYAREFGDYPRAVGSPGDLYRALQGRLGPNGEEIAGRSCVAGLGISLRDERHPDNLDNSFLDPWGREYQYVSYTRTRGSLGETSGYVLYSLGDPGDATSAPKPADFVPERSGERGGCVVRNAETAAVLFTKS